MEIGYIKIKNILYAYLKKNYDIHIAHFFSQKIIK